MAAQTVRLGDIEVSFERAGYSIGLTPEETTFKVNVIRASDGVSKSFDMSIQVDDDTSPNDIAAEAHLAFFRLLYD